MARVEMQEGTGIASLSGRMGNLVFRTLADGQTIAQQAPAATKRPGSAAQQQWRRGTFREAVAYGNQQKRDPAGIAYYEPFRQPGRFSSIYSLALADYSKPPQVLALEAPGYQGQAGALVRVQAHDPFGVVAVQVQVLNASGQVREEGPALLVADNWWVYATTQAHLAGTGWQLRALAQDRPGNEGVMQLVLE